MSGERVIYVDPAGREAEVVSAEEGVVVLSIAAYEVVDSEGKAEVIPAGEWRGSVADFRCGWVAR